MKLKITINLILMSFFLGTAAFAQTDHSETSMGFYGNGVDGGGWTEVVHYHDPDVDGDLYTWSWAEISLLGGDGRAFIFLEKLEDELWGGLQFDYEQTTVVDGSAIDNGYVVDERDVGGDHANYHVVVGGSYDITLVYNSNSGESTVTINSTDDGPEMGLFGNAFEGYPEEDHWSHPGFEPHAPEIDGNLLSWSWNETGLIEGRSFIFLEAAGWGGLFFDYTHPTLEGDAFDNDYIVNEQSVGGGDPNYYVAEGGVYDLTLVYNTSTQEATVTINSAGESGPEMGLFGNAFEGYPEEDHWSHPGFEPHAPEIDGDLYTWSWNETGLIEGRAFIFLEAAGWGGLFFDYTHPTLEGDAFDNDFIVNEQSVGGGDPNFFVAEGGVYDLTLEYNTSTQESTVSIFVSSGTNVEITDRVEDFKLAQNYPNPFNPGTTIEFALPTAEMVRLEVYNMIGQRVAILLNEQMSAGAHNVAFDASGLSSGMYIYRIQAGEFAQVRKMTLIK